MVVAVAMTLSNSAQAPAATSPTTTSSVMLPTTAPPGPASTWPPPLFSPAQSYDLGGPGSAVAAADLNGDGRTDLVMNTGDGTPDQLVVLYQAAGGALDRAVYFDTDAGVDHGRVVNVATGDVDGDGRADVVVQLGAGLDVLLQRNGTFADRTYHDMDLPGAAHLADLDGDGKADLVVAGRGISVHRGLGDGTFAAPMTVDSAMMSVSELAIGDVTGDGRPDLVIMDYIWAYDQVVVYRQLADGGFAGGLRIDAGGSRGSLAIGDFNSDGRFDLAVSHTVVAGGPIAQVRFLQQQPDGTLASAGDIDADSLGPMRVGDVDGNGRTDLVGMVGGARTEVYVVLQGEDGRMVEVRGHPMPFDSSFSSTGFVVADLTGDKRLDVAVANDHSGLDVARNVSRGVPQLATPASTYHPVAPQRVLDTRTGLGAPAARLAGGASVGLQVAGRGGVPALGVSAVVLNVTVTEPTAVSFLTAWPAGSARPLASNLNFGPGQTVPNLVVVKVGPDGKVNLFNHAGAVHVIADVAGWYGADTLAYAGRYTPVTPARILDTRTGVGAVPFKVGPGSTTLMQVTGRGAVPATGVSAVVLNVTVTEPTAVSFLTAWPNGETRPLASNLNYVAGQTVPNLVVVKVGSEGRINLYNHAGSTHIVADVAGWFGVDSPGPAGALTPLAPTRILDTRSAVGAPAGPVGHGGTVSLQVTGRGGIPASGVSAVVLNVTVTEASAVSFLTAWPEGEPRPLASNLNYSGGQTVPNLVVVKVGAGGRVSLFNNAGTAHVIADVAGWYG